jgi:hypothetical protein
MQLEHWRATRAREATSPNLLATYTDLKHSFRPASVTERGFSSGLAGYTAGESVGPATATDEESAR